MPPTYQSQSLDGMLPVTSCVESSSVNTVSNVDKAQLLDSANVSPSTVEQAKRLMELATHAEDSKVLCRIEDEVSLLPECGDVMNSEINRILDNIKRDLQPTVIR